MTPDEWDELNKRRWEQHGRALDAFHREWAALADVRLALSRDALRKAMGL